MPHWKCALLAISCLVTSLSEAQISPGKLPIKRVVLFKNGVGYFEHVGSVRGNELVGISFTSGQLNDVLKSLTVLDLNGGRIAGVAYGTAAPMARQMGDLRLAIGEKATLPEVLSALRGSRMEIRNAGSVTSGRLLSVDRRARVSGLVTQDVDSVSLISEAGELKTAELLPSTSIRLLEPGMGGRLEQFLNLVSSEREADARNMVISTEGSGERKLYVSYISEVPVWKSTYRLVLDSNGGPLLQGWAIVDNVVGEDWKDVELSLVAGAPQSFIQNLSQPYYAQRPVVDMPNSVSIAPQTYEATLLPGSAEVQGSATDGSNSKTPGAASQTAQVQAKSPPVSVGSGRNLGRGTATGRMGRGQGDGFGLGSGGGAGGGVYKIGAKSVDLAALSQTLGDLFEYKLKDPITILKNRSALVPILQSQITAEKVSVWNGRDGVPRPQRAVWITNTTGLTLDGGSVSVLEGDTFTGEGIVDPIRPGEKRLLSFATDLAVVAKSSVEGENERVSRVVINKGTLTQQIERREKKTYTFRNEDTQPRTIVVEHPVRAEYQLAGDVHPVETTADWMRFRINVQPKQTASLTVEEFRPIESKFALTNISSDQVTLFISQRSIDSTIQEGLQEVLLQKNAIAALEGEKSKRDEEAQTIFDDQQRLRENVKALKGTPEEKPLLQRYTQQLNDQETRLTALRAETSKLDSRIDAANEKLNQTIEELSFDVRL